MCASRKPASGHLGCAAGWFAPGRVAAEMPHPRLLEGPILGQHVVGEATPREVDVLRGSQRIQHPLPEIEKPEEERRVDEEEDALLYATTLERLG